VSFEDNRLLEQAGDTLFSGENPLPAEAVRVQQGSVELSNVQSVVEMTRMIEVTRAYTQISSMIAKQDDLRLKAISQLGDVRA
ncbi:MAG TPA: flagellar basal body rod C-terminal domain-containing protein, partial [Methylomirabilota bacterium]|nr:flagellar basal body rod C-terminal domain-containing protein [Methylomirabilota bacterium]